jgi:KaiC/GvpD/RAD55 family RecA-like ATPase
MTNSTAYNFITLDELYKQPLEIDWIIEDIIPSNSVGMIYGPSGSGKSHVILSIAAMIANGRDWFNKESKQGNVLVMAGKGLSGLSRRLRAIEKEHDLSIVQDKLHISSRAIGLDTENGYKQVEQAISELDAPPKLIFIDTLSRHLMDSEENSNDDMARFINKLEDIRLKYGCTIVLVHHTGKGGNQTARGASALKANIDFSFFVDGENKSCSFSCDKMKDADDAIPTKYFEIKAVDLGIVTSKDKPITGACIVDSTKPISIKVNKQNKDELAYSCFNSDKKLWQQAYLDACTDAISAESKAKQYREGRKALIVAGKVIENQDGSFSVNDGV